MSQWRQKKGGFGHFDWQSEELLPFAKVYSKVATESHLTVAHTRIYEYFLGRFFHGGERKLIARDEEYEKFRVKVLVAGLVRQATLTSGKLAGDPFS